MTRPSLSLADIFSDNMVLQRGRPVPVWGWAAPGAAVRIQFAGQEKSAAAGANGRWEARLDALGPCAEPRDLRVTSPGASPVLLRNVLVGDVWLCSGQSNMEFSLYSANQGAAESRAATFPSLRLFTVLKQKAEVRQDRLSRTGWQACRPETAGPFSAVAYFFGRELFRRLAVPIGLVHSAWGGTVAEAWTSDDALRADPALRPLAEARLRQGPPEESARAAYERAMKALEARTRDRGNAGWERGWADVGEPAGDWKEMALPRLWRKVEGLDFNGVLWFRKEVNLPAAWVGRELRLSIGACDKSDTTYFNNTAVGRLTMEDSPDAWCRPRIYPVPAALTAARRAVIAVRVHSNMYGGGMTGPAEEMELTCPSLPDSPAIPLAGLWRYATEQNYGRIEPPQPPDSPNVPSLLFNAMIAPLIPMALRGVIWYQGESNASRARQYRTLFPALIRDWRAQWGQGDFPFLFVQLANYAVIPKQPMESSWSELREAQTMALRLPATGMAVAIDIGDPEDIHPRNKQEVGRRLALCALKDVYGIREIASSGPMFRDATREGSALRVRFRHAENLAARGGSVEGFALAGPDRHFVWAQARIEGDSVLVSAPSVAEPEAVRYAWADSPVCNLYNAAGLPAAPFRSDSDA